VLEAPMLALPLVAWLGRRRDRDRTRNGGYAILDDMTPHLAWRPR
jgi:hypothetical protein